MEIVTIEDDDIKDVVSSTKQTSPFMTKYEYTALIAARSLMIYYGEEPEVDITGCFDPAEIAKKELHERVIPLQIRRRLNDGTTENWRVEEMHIRNW